MGANGTASVDFGAWPGSVEASVDVAGQSGLVAASRLEAWVMPIQTADHTADEHVIEALKVYAVYKVDGTLTIHAGIDAPRGGGQQGSINDDEAEIGIQKHLLYGLYSIGWVWA